MPEAEATYAIEGQLCSLPEDQLEFFQSWRHCRRKLNQSLLPHHRIGTIIQARSRLSHGFCKIVHCISKVDLELCLALFFPYAYFRRPHARSMPLCQINAS